MTAAAVALVGLIGWLAGVQTVRVGQDRSAPLSRAALVATAVLCAAVVLLVVPQVEAARQRAGRAPDLTAVALVAVIAWLVGQQVLRVGLDRNPRPSRAVLATTAVIAGGAGALVVPRLYLMVT
jgi:cytochrome bd-type quinol oxidase subunit 2